MNERIMEAVKEIEAIRDAMGKEYALNANGKKIAEWQYFYKNDPNNLHPICKNKARATSDRTKMIEVLRRFYLSNCRTHEGMDDFVTLFGVYCNQYIRFNLHQALPDEDDFGISALWDTITDEKMQTYLGLLRQGIFNGISDMHSFFDAGEMISDYSLPYLYLYMYDLIIFSHVKGNIGKALEDEEFTKGFLIFYNHMNHGLQDYCLGRGIFVRDEIVASIPVDENPLPYIRFRNQKQFGCTVLASRMEESWKRIKRHIEWKDGEVISKLHSDDENGRVEFALAMHILNESSKEIVSLQCENEQAELCRRVLAKSKKRNADLISERLYFLSIPYTIDDDTGPNILHHLMEQMNAKEKAKKEIVEIQKEKDEIVENFTHTYKNMRATNLCQLAKTLLNKPEAEDRKLGRDALLEYTRKASMNKAVSMMNLRYERNTDKLRSVLRKSCALPSSETHTIRDVLEQSLLLCLANAFYERGEETARIMRGSLKKFWRDWKETGLDFEKSVIVQEGSSLQWLRRHAINIRVEMRDVWDTVGFYPDGYAAVFLRNILTELFVNLFKYGDLQQEAVLTFADQGDSLAIRMENFLPDGRHGTSDSQKGIKTTEKMLQTLWGEDAHGENIKRLTAAYEENKFRICLALPKSVFFNEEEKK